MKRYLTSTIFTLAIVGFYFFTDIRFFSLNLTKMTRENLFNLRTPPAIDEDIILLNIGKLKSNKIPQIVDSILQLNPKIIGINLCHYGGNVDISMQYQRNSRVIFTNCNDKTPIYSQSRIIASGNIVSHFKSDQDTYFESKIAEFSGGDNSIELIHYGNKNHFYKRELTEWNWGMNHMYKDKVVLIGYMGDYLSDEIYDFKNCRITPLNNSFGEDNIVPDMYDIEISANIISTIVNKKFINEINFFSRVLILLFFSLINVILLTYLKTRWLLANLIIATITFMILCLISSLMLVYLFNSGYYLSIDELPYILLTVTVFMAFLDLLQQKKPITN